MGWAKQHQLEVEGRGYGDLDGETCLTCLGEGPIQGIVDPSQLHMGVCTYCGIATDVLSLEDFLGLLVSRIHTEYQNFDSADNPLDPETGLPIFKTEEYSTADVLYEEGFEPKSEQLFQDLCNTISIESWCAGNPLELSEAEALSMTWEAFCTAVRTRHRFTFFQIPDVEDDWGPHEDLSIARMLERVAKGYDALRPWSSCPVGTQFYRARPSLGFKFGKDLGTCPNEGADANRMSPEGIGMFYGAFESETCLREILKVEAGRYQECTMGSFQTTCPLVLLDLTQIHPSSVFDDQTSSARGFAQFSQKFQKHIAAPLAAGKKQKAVEYAPTQILTEFFRHRTIGEFGRPVDGLIYRSAMHPGGRCVVLFIENNECGNLGEPRVRLELIDSSEIRAFLRPDKPVIEL